MNAHTKIEAAATASPLQAWLDSQPQPLSDTHVREREAVLWALSWAERAGVSLAERQRMCASALADFGQS